MQKRRLGTSDLVSGPLAFGGNVFGWTADEKTSFELLDRFVDAGLSLIDTADIYSRWVPGHEGGESEAIIGRWMKSRGTRDKVLIATKVGMDMGNGQTGLSRQRITRAVEASLKRLQTDYIDLYQSHTDDFATPLEETAAAFGDLAASGKVRVLGASNFSAQRLEAALHASDQAKAPRYRTLQPEYNLYTRSPFEAEVQGLCVKEGIGVIPYYPLAAGFLTGKYRSAADRRKSVRGDGAAQYMNPRGFRILKALDAVASEYKVSQAAVALAWLLQQPAVVAPIVSATSVEQMTDLLAAANLHLDEAAMRTLAAASAP